ncbi:MAG: M48 family metallopeptidase [Cyanobacteria bacterium J06560_2]
MKYIPKEITEEVNTTPVNPLVNLAYLLGTVALGCVVIYALLGVVATEIAKHINPEAEEKIGTLLVQTVPLRKEGAGAEGSSDSRLVYLNELVASIQSDLEQAGFESDGYPLVKVGILDTPVENAMVMAGSYLFVTEGLLAEVTSENELAFVLAHEIGHLYNRDAVTALGRSLVWLSMNALLGVGQQGGSVVPSAFNLAELNYGRGQETAADDIAIALIQTRYTHGDHSLDFFRRAQSQEPDFGAFGQVAEWRQTHPLSQSRIQRLEEILRTNGYSLTGEATPLPENLGCINLEPCDAAASEK